MTQSPAFPFRLHATRSLTALAQRPSLGLLLAIACTAACAPRPTFVPTDNGNAAMDAADTGLPADDREVPPPSETGTNDVPAVDPPFVPDPTTCAEAAESHSYVGCDFWPTVTPNVVGKHFDYAIVISNAGDEPAGVVITRGSTEIARATIAPRTLQKFFVPWVDALKHFLGNCDTDPTPPFSARLESRHVVDGAYHVETTRPVTVFQFNPIEYGPRGGPPGRNWQACMTGCLFGCKSYSNDASLLMPSTSLTGNYRIMGPAGQNTMDVHQPGYITVTGLRDRTSVRFRLSATAFLTGAGSIPSARPGDTVDFMINRGEVVLLVGTNTGDLSGSQLYADQPVQVISGAPCLYMPDDRGACDHLEETIPPAETLGTHYFVTVPTNPRGRPISHVVRLYGNHDETNLEYPNGRPMGAPGSLQAGQVVDLGLVASNFEVRGSYEFGVTSFLPGGTLLDPGHLLDGLGDPAQTNAQPVEQYRKRYVFLSPDDYDVSYADVIAPMGATLTLDGMPVTATPTSIGSNYNLIRILLNNAMGGAHQLESTLPVGLQIVGYGFATSYSYPGGLNLLRVAPPPPIPG